MIRVLNDSINLIDFRTPKSEEYDESLIRANSNDRRCKISSK